MFIYIVINEINYPIGTFIDISDARKYKETGVNYKIIKSTLVGDLPTNNVSSKLKDKMALPEDLKNLFGMKI